VSQLLWNSVCILSYTICPFFLHHVLDLVMFTGTFSFERAFDGTKVFVSPTWVINILVSFPEREICQIEMHVLRSINYTILTIFLAAAPHHIVQLCLVIKNYVIFQEAYLILTLIWGGNNRVVPHYTLRYHQDTAILRLLDNHPIMIHHIICIIMKTKWPWKGSFCISRRLKLTILFVPSVVRKQKCVQSLGLNVAGASIILLITSNHTVGYLLSKWFVYYCTPPSTPIGSNIFNEKLIVITIKLCKYYINNILMTITKSLQCEASHKLFFRKS